MATTARACAALSGFVHVEAEHHPALVVLGDVAVRHPRSGIGDVQEDVDGLSGADEHCVLPDQIALVDAVSRQDQETSRSVNVKWMWHRMVRVHLVDQSNLHAIADVEPPV